MNTTKFVRVMMMVCAAAVALAVQAGPTSIAYQGVLRDAQGAKLTEKSKVVEFRLYAEPTGEMTTALWGRSISVLLDDDGLFNVSLDDTNGAQLENVKYTNLVEAIRAARVSSIYVGLNVKDSSGEITPRQKLLQVPYATFAYDVEKATGNFTVEGQATVKNLSVEGTAKFTEIDIEGAATFSQPVQFNGGITVNAANEITGRGTIPKGGIILWSGSVLPDGWALCDGTDGTPDLRGLFVMGANRGELGRKIVGGNENNRVTLTTNNMPKHSHNYFGDDQLEGLDGNANSSTVKMRDCPGYDATSQLAGKSKVYSTSSTGNGQSFDITPRYYKLAYIMRVK